MRRACLTRCIIIQVNRAHARVVYNYTRARKARQKRTLCGGQGPETRTGKAGKPANRRSTPRSTASRQRHRQLRGVPLPDWPLATLRQMVRQDRLTPLRTLPASGQGTPCREPRQPTPATGSARRKPIAESKEDQAASRSGTSPGTVICQRQQSHRQTLRTLRGRRPARTSWSARS